MSKMTHTTYEKHVLLLNELLLGLPKTLVRLSWSNVFIAKLNYITGHLKWKVFTSAQCSCVQEIGHFVPKMRTSTVP